MKLKTIATSAILILSFLFAGSAFAKSEKLSDLDSLKKPSYNKVFMKNAVDADSISNVFDVPPVNDFEQFKMKLAPTSGTTLTRRYKAAPVRIKKTDQEKTKKNTKPRFRDFFGSNKKEL